MVLLILYIAFEYFVQDNIMFINKRVIEINI